MWPEWKGKPSPAEGGYHLSLHNRWRWSITISFNKFGHNSGEAYTVDGPDFHFDGVYGSDLPDPILYFVSGYYIFAPVVWCLWTWVEVALFPEKPKRFHCISFWTKHCLNWCKKMWIRYTNRNAEVATLHFLSPEFVMNLRPQWKF